MAALQWADVIASVAEYASGGGNWVNGRLYCDVSRSNNTITVTGIQVGHSLSSGYDDFEWQAYGWCNGTLVINNQTKGRTGSNQIGGNWYYSPTVSHSFSVGAGAGSFALQGNWRADHYGQQSAARTVSVAYPAAGAPTIDSNSVSEEAVSTAKVTWTSSNGTYCSFVSMELQYGLTTGYGNTVSGLAADGNITLTGLAPGTTYHYRLKITNGAGLVTYSNDATFTTKPVGFFDVDL